MLGRLLQSHKTELINTNNPMTRTRLAIKLQSSTEGTQTMTSHEHGTIMCSMANFYTTAIETLRREMVSYRAIISNLAAVAQRELMEIAIIAQHVIEAFPATSNDTSTATTKNATTATSVTPSAATKEATTLSKSYQLECFDSSTRLPRHFHEAWFGAEP